jgi:hypothetical protein
MSGTHNGGYTNWATWFVVSEMQNYQKWYELYEKLIRAKAPAEEFENVARKCMCPHPNGTDYDKILHEHFADVDWNNIRETLIGD